MSYAIIAFVAMLLANAEPQMRDQSPFPPAGADPCGAANYEHLIGQPVPDKAELEAIGSPERIRVIHPGQPVTMDHIRSRLNVEVDAGGLVIRLRCG